MSKMRSLEGLRFGRWTVGTLAFISSRFAASWNCICDCGVARTVRRDHLVSGKSKSCGCLQREVVASIVGLASTTHGLARQGKVVSEFWIWSHMKQRCSNPNNEYYADYGGRGIEVCERWQKFENFYSDMGQRPSGLTLERKNVNEGYSLDNCIWASRAQQARNKRTSHFITFNGRTQVITDWASEVGLSHQTIGDRLRAGWSVEDALTRPSGKRKILQIADNAMMEDK